MWLGFEPWFSQLRAQLYFCSAPLIWRLYHQLFHIHHVKWFMTIKCLISHDTIQWWADLSECCRFRPHLNTHLVVKQLTHYLGLNDLNRKWSCFCCFGNLFENSLNVQCIHDISHILWIFDESIKYEKIIWRYCGCGLISLSKALGITIVRR